MLLAQPVLVCLLLLITSPKRVKLQATNMCRRMNEGQLRMCVLTGHVISNQVANGFDECAELCANNPSCYSVNYYNEKRKCELNDKTSFNNPEHMVKDLDGSYLDIHRPYKHCSDFFCNLEDACMMDRVDHNYCKACNSALGMENGAIKASQITASSIYNNIGWVQPSSGRLNNPDGFWSPNRHEVGAWLQIDFIHKVAVANVATQGRRPRDRLDRWVTSYKLSYSDDAVVWEVYKKNGKEKIFTGNTDRNTVVSHALAPKIRQARYVRFVVMTWNGNINLRVEVYGCQE